jgi:hypothetical protein
MSAFRCFPVVAVIAASGCVRAEVLSLDPAPRAPTSPDSVRVLAQEPSQKYSVLAIVSVQSDLGRGSMLELTHGLRREAARLGGNGVLIGTDAVSETKNGRFMRGRVILFDSIAPPAQPALAKPSYTGRIVKWSILGGVLVAGGLYALLAQGSEPINPYDWSCDHLGGCVPKASP